MSAQNAEENTLDDEVSACLSGLPGYKSDDDQSSSPSSCSFHSSHTVAGVDSEVDSMSNYSWHSTGTLRDVDTDTASYCSVDTVMGDSEVDNMSNYSFYSTGTLRDADTDTASFCSADTVIGDTEGGKEEVNITKMVEDGDTKSSNKRQSKDSSPDLPEDDPSTNITPHSSTPDFSFTRPGYLAGSNSSVDNDSRSSLVSEGDISLAGQVNDRLGQLLGYAGEGADGVDAEDAIANIMGYEIVVKEKDKFTVYKIRVSCPSSVFRTWFIHRRYSDFFNLRQTLIKENQASAPKLAFPSKRWVGSNFDPTFLGRRLAGLQVFLGNILDVKALKTNKALMEFLCLDKPPVGQTGIEDKRAICDTLEEAVKELRKQLRKKDLLMKELDYQKNLNSEKDNQIQELYTENKLLRKQKESLMNSLSCGRKMSVSSSKVETLEDFTAKFQLKSGEGPMASTPFTSDPEHSEPGGCGGGDPEHSEPAGGGDPEHSEPGGGDPEHSEPGCGGGDPEHSEPGNRKRIHSQSSLL